MTPVFTSKLLEWNTFHNKRDMPWKGESDPYRIWLSEIILQQTRVEQGWAYYERFIARFPDVHSLAAAHDNDIYKLWEGLGYYSRCKNLIATARYISTQLNGKFPCTYEQIIHLKGVGPYTAAAISSFAFNEKRAVVDGNVQRVLSRYFGIATPVDTNEGKNVFHTLAASLIDDNYPAQYNQAIMDFGATVCKPQNPLCNDCIQRHECAAFNNNMVNELPVKSRSLKKKNRWLYYFLIGNEDSLYIRQRQENDIWQNLHEFVLLESPTELTDPLHHHLSNLLQHQSFSITYESEVRSQQLTHQHIKGRFIGVNVSGKLPSIANYRLVKKIHLHEYAFPRFINNFLENSFFKEALNN